LTAIDTLRWKEELDCLIAKYLEFGWKKIQSIGLNTWKSSGGKIQFILEMFKSKIATNCFLATKIIPAGTQPEPDPS